MGPNTTDSTFPRCSEVDILHLLLISLIFFPKALKSCLEKKVTKSFIAAEFPWVCPTAIQKSLSSEPPAVGTFPRVLKHTKVTDTSEMHLGLNLMIYY